MKDHKNMIPEWIRVLYLYLLSGNPGLMANNLEVYTDAKGKHWIHLRQPIDYITRNPSVQEFLDGLQDE